MSWYVGYEEDDEDEEEVDDVVPFVSLKLTAGVCNVVRIRVRGLPGATGLTGGWCWCIAAATFS